MSESHGMEEFDSETRSLLMQGMSAEAAQASMGLMATGGDSELAATIRREHEELARDMEEKNRQANKRRAALLTGKSETEVPQSSLEQKPVKKKGRKGMKKQEASKVAKTEFLREPAQGEHAPIAPVQALPEQPEPGTGIHAAGLTQADIDLIESVKASHARSRDNFVEQRETVHPGAFDARMMNPTYVQQQQQMAEPQYDPEYARQRLQQPDMMAPQLMPNVDGRNPGWDQNADPYAANRALEHKRLMEAANRTPTQQEMEIRNERNMAAFNGQGNPNYGQQYQYGQVSMPQVTRIPPPAGNMANTQAFMDAARGIQPVPSQTMPPPEPMPQAPAFNPGARTATQYVQPPVVNMTPPETPTFNPGVPDKDFEAFTEITEWPSHGLFYPEKVYGQSLKTIDVFMLADTTDDDVNATLTTILGRRLRGIPSPEDILACDEEYLLYWLRASSYPENEAGLPKMKFDCPECGRHYRDMAAVQLLPGVSFNDLVFRTEVPPEEIAAKHAANGYVTFNTYDGRECNVYLKRRKHDRIMDEYISEWELANNDVFPRYRKESLAIAAVMEIEDCETITEKMEYIEAYPLSERNKLFMSVLNSQIITKTYVRIKCPNCGGTATLPYPFRLRNYVASL